MMLLYLRIGGDSLDFKCWDLILCKENDASELL